MGKRLKKSLLLLTIMTLVLTTLISCEKDSKPETTLTPGEHVTEAYMNTFKEGSIDISSKATIDLNYDEMAKMMSLEGLNKEMFELINNISANINYKLIADKEAKSFDYFLDYDINYKTNPILSMEFLFNKEAIGFGLTNFFDKYFVVKFDGLMESMVHEEAEMLSEIDFDKYLTILFDTETKGYQAVEESGLYKTILVEHFNKYLDEGVNEEIIVMVNGEEIKENVITYKYNFNFQSYMTLYASLIDEAKNDEDLKLYIQSLGSNMINEFIESKDYELFDVTEEDVIIVQTVFESDFDAGWDEVMATHEETFNGLDTDLDELGEEGQLLMDVYENIDFKLSINDKDVVRNFNMAINYNGIGVTIDYIVNATGSDVVIESKEDQYVDIMQFIDVDSPNEIQNKEEFAQLIKDMLLSAIDELVNGEGIKALLDDLEPFGEEFGLDVNMATTYLEMGRMYINNMQTTEIIELIEAELTPVVDYD